MHEAALAMLRFYSPNAEPTADTRARVEQEFKQNVYQPATGTLPYTAGQAHAFEHLVSFYRDYFTTTANQRGLKRPQISDPEEVRRLTAYFSWAAWVATAVRPGAGYSYTNNWPPEPLAGNHPTAEAFLWSVLSLIALLGGTGLLLFIIGRYNLLGWHRADEELSMRNLRFRPPEEVRLGARPTGNGLVLPRRRRPVPAPRLAGRRQCTFPRGAGRLLRSRR